MDHYQITYDNGQIFRIENENSGAITIRSQGDTARILSIYVPEKDRNEEIGKGLLGAAEEELFRRGIRQVEADYSESLTDVTGLLKSSGYHLAEAAPIMALDLKGFLASERAKKGLARDIEDGEFITLEDLSTDNWKDMMEYLDGFGIKLSSYDIARFSRSLSGVMCDGKGNKRAVLLCTEENNNINIEFLAGMSKKDTRYVVYAMVEMLRYVSGRSNGKGSIITVIASNPVTVSLLESVPKSEYGPYCIGHSIFAGKRLKKELHSDIAVNDDIDEDKADEWRREIGRIPYQPNIAFKMIWEPTQGINEVYNALKRGEFDEN